jgi:hypothetical protein
MQNRSPVREKIQSLSRRFNFEAICCLPIPIRCGTPRSVAARVQVSGVPIVAAVAHFRTTPRAGAFPLRCIRPRDAKGLPIVNGDNWPIHARVHVGPSPRSWCGEKARRVSATDAAPVSSVRFAGSGNPGAAGHEPPHWVPSIDPDKPKTQNYASPTECFPVCRA